MTEQDRQIKEQNKRINELTRRVSRLEQAVPSLEKAIEPEGWISQAFEKVEEHLTEQDNKITGIQYRLDRMDGKLEVILEHLTRLSDLPEE